MSNNTQNLNSKPIQRLFEMKEDILFMYSKIPGSFGDLILMTSIDLLPRYDEENDPVLGIHQTPSVGRTEDFPLEFRLGEMYYFLQIVPLFNPQNRTDYGLPSSSSFSEDS